MKIRTAIIAAIMLGVFSYSLPLYAGNNSEYYVEERTVIEIPVVGKISTHTSSYLAGCKLKKTTTIKMHNTLIKMMSDSEGISEKILLSDLCEKLRWRYDEDQKAYTSVSFAEVRQERLENEVENESHIDMESDQNDIDDFPQMTHEIMGYEKNINGFKARKVVTRVYRENSENPIVIEEYYATDIRPLKKITDALEKVAQEMGEGDNHVQGVPSFIKAVYDGIREDKDLDRPAGDIVRFVISLLDDDDDPMFRMQYDVLKAEKIAFEADHFVLK